MSSPHEIPKRWLKRGHRSADPVLLTETIAAAARRIGMENAVAAARKYRFPCERSEFYKRAAAFRSKQRRRKRA